MCRGGDRVIRFKAIPDQQPKGFRRMLGDLFSHHPPTPPQGPLLANLGAIVQKLTVLSEQEHHLMDMMSEAQPADVPLLQEALADVLEEKSCLERSINPQ
jgi:hypothetical protein